MLDLGSSFVGIINQNVHFHRQAALGGAGANATEANDQHRFPE